MKNTKGWLVTALILILIGGLLFAGALGKNNWKLDGLGGRPLEITTIRIREDFHSLSIRADTEDVRLVPSDDGACSVVFFVSEKDSPVASVENDTLSVKVLKPEKWYESFTFFSTETPSITVYLPRAEYDALLIEESTGDVKIPADFRFADIAVSSSTGDLACFASAAGAIRMTSNTGDIRLEDLSAGTLELSVSTGRVELRGVDCAGDVSVTVSTGDAKLTDLSCRSLRSAGSTGGISLERVIAAEKITIERSTGDLRLEKCDAAELYLKTSTGDVTGTLLTGKVFSVQSNTGRIDVPKTVTGGLCEVSSSTGDIELRIADN